MRVLFTVVLTVDIGEARISCWLSVLSSCRKLDECFQSMSSFLNQDFSSVKIGAKKLISSVKLCKVFNLLTPISMFSEEVYVKRLQNCKQVSLLTLSFGVCVVMSESMLLTATSVV